MMLAVPSQVIAFVKSLKFQRSTAYQHGRDLLQLVEEYRPWFVIPGTERLKPVMVLMVDGGQDEHPRFYGQVSCTRVSSTTQKHAGVHTSNGNCMVNPCALVHNPCCHTLQLPSQCALLAMSGHSPGSCPMQLVCA